MAKTIQVVIDVASDSVSFATDQTLTLTQQVRLLYKELQKIPQGTKEFDLVNKKFNDTKDSLDKVSAKSRELFGTLSTLPGPIGEFSGKLQGGIDLLKVLSSFSFKDIKTAFKNLAEDVVEVFSNLSGGSKAIAEVNKEAKSATNTLSDFSLAFL
jgi:methyl-accepting chemotaxis protein